LSEIARILIADPANAAVFSVASIWEVAIKASPGRDGFRVNPREFRDRLLANDYSELAVLSEHAIALSSLPTIHNDPFDRILVAQAMAEGPTLLTADPIVAKYPKAVRRV
jgi:PIN domain nuclease of toxin-antitoxin system